MKITTLKFEVYLPEERLPALQAALEEAGLCRVGRYSHVMAVTRNRGFWMPLEGSDPWLGKTGEVSSEWEVKAEFPCPADRAAEAEKVIRAVHPYEEPVYYILPALNDLFGEGSV